MTVGSFIQTSGVSPSTAKAKTYRKSAQGKGNRFRNDRTLRSKPMHGSRIQSFDSPSRESSHAIPIPRRRRSDEVRGSPETPYAGAKFSSPPPPSVLPKPPLHWIAGPSPYVERDVAAMMSQHLRTLLNVAS
ncbi:predicted protein [Nematostella vectensis]|uniref:Uncharacterized protein n=1 Tax=Nematostella vectensis TaxID=45351 RepID=A7RH30_NEMVE|nr:predicted protein [Nematostella vectensis]|eukprot:XP_001641212.1 predicted protein [Nematostella vectensis]